MAADTESQAEEEKRKRDQVGKFLQKNFVKGELALKHAVGLGHTPNNVPLAPPKVDGPPRPVEVGWHPVGGLAGKWFAEQTGLGKLITEKVNHYPDPTQHWAVLVGDFAHQLWMDENFDVIYTNEKIVRDEWRLFPVGQTHFNDDAVRRAGESVIEEIRKVAPAYNLITNNCQTYALKLLDAIKAGVVQEFGTTLAVYERLFGPGKVADLFSNPDMPVQEQQQQLDMQHQQPPQQQQQQQPYPAQQPPGQQPQQQQYPYAPPPQQQQQPQQQCQQPQPYPYGQQQQPQPPQQYPPQQYPATQPEPYGQQLPPGPPPPQQPYQQQQYPYSLQGLSGHQQQPQYFPQGGQSTVSIAQQVMDNNTHQVAQGGPLPPPPVGHDTMSVAQHLMRTNTAQVDVREGSEKAKKKGLFSRFLKK